MSTGLRGPLGSSETEITKESISHPLLSRSRQRVASLIELIGLKGDRLRKEKKVDTRVWKRSLSETVDYD